MEGGFNGRTNKLVDGCYAFWIGALFPIINNTMAVDLFNTSKYVFIFFSCLESLQKYIINCCQNKFGGLRDKVDMYIHF